MPTIKLKATVPAKPVLRRERPTRATMLNNKKLQNNKQQRRQPVRLDNAATQRQGRSSRLPPVSRNTGNRIITEVYSAQPFAVYLDYIGLSTILGLKRDFETYEKWFARGFKLEFIPNQPVTTGGNIFIAPDYDPLDVVPETMAELSESFNYLSKPISQRAICNMPNFKTGSDYIRPTLFCGPTDVDRMVSYGKFVGSATSTAADDTHLGSLVLHWDIDFFVRSPIQTRALDTSTVAQLVCQCDNSGTVGVVPYMGDTGKDEVIAANSVGSTVSMHKATHSATIKELTNCTLETTDGKAVNPGTRIYFKPIEAKIDTSGFVTPVSTNYSVLGKLNLSRTFADATNILINRTVAATIHLLGTKVW